MIFLSFSLAKVGGSVIQDSFEHEHGKVEAEEAWWKRKDPKQVSHREWWSVTVTS